MFVTKNSKPGMPIYQILCTLCHAQHAVKLVPGSTCHKHLSVMIPNLPYISCFLGCCANVLRLFQYMFNMFCMFAVGISRTKTEGDCSMSQTIYCMSHVSIWKIREMGG
uniref:Uncharacterized protein n=1 Tax=Rhipicephalus zambeziensis TaxID=60191 RepID=A0A224Y9R7_9ACAR